jgi:CHAT domain-containing protein
MKKFKGQVYSYIKSLFRKFSFIFLSLITFLLVTTGLPVAAQHLSVASSVGQVSDAAKLLSEGKSFYERGSFSEAIERWERASKDYELQNDRSGQALSLSYLSLAYQEMGELEKAQKAIDRSIDLLKKQPQLEANSTAILAKALNARGSIELRKGQTEAALETWQEAEKNYDLIGDKTGVLGSQIDRIQALQTLGLYRRSQFLLEQIQQKLQAEPDSQLKAAGLRSLGVVEQVVGNLTKSKELLEQSLAVARNLNLPSETSATLFSLGNTARSLQDYPIALEFYQQAAETTPSTLARLEARINQLSLLLAEKNLQEAETLFKKIESDLANLAASRPAIYARVNLAQTIIDAQFKLENSARILATAVQKARELKDTRAESYALGTLAHLYERNQQVGESLNLTRQALTIALEINAVDIAYQWQWQLGRLLKAQGNIEEAIAAETEAYKNIQSIRSDLIAINPEVQFSFKESVEPLYRDLVSLLLRSSEPEKIPQENLKQAREVIESLQLGEIENFLKESCLDAQPKQIDQIDRTAAAIYPIILPDRLAVILSIPDKPLSYYETKLSQQEIESTLEQLLQSLNPAFSNQLRLGFSQQVYDWLIRPGETELNNNNIKTLVFVPEGLLRNIPMSALYDGQQYLVQKYSIALAPSLQLLEPRALETEKLRAITAGVSQASQGFAPLPGVETELTEISQAVPSAQLLNQQFTSENFQKEISETTFPVIHLATHGQFSSNPEETFVLTWDSQVKVRDFEELLRSRARTRTNPIELLVLSACETAEGDNRAALGLAGMAVRSGARSTIATLWSVKDESTALLMTEFYQKLVQPTAKITKAEALRQAQTDLLNSPEYKHPFYWAPFILVGNWL